MKVYGENHRLTPSYRHCAEEEALYRSAMEAAPGDETRKRIIALKTERKEVFSTIRNKMPSKTTYQMNP